MIVNGNEMQIDQGSSIEDVLKSLNLDMDLVVVEVDYEIVKKDDYKSFILDDRSNVEIVAFVGGG